MDGVWNTFKYPPKPFVTRCQIKAIQGQEVKKVKYKILGLGGVIHVYRSDFLQEHKNDPRIHFERPKPDKI